MPESNTEFVKITLRKFTANSVKSLQESLAKRVKSAPVVRQNIHQAVLDYRNKTSIQDESVINDGMVTELKDLLNYDQSKAKRKKVELLAEAVGDYNQAIKIYKEKTQQHRSEIDKQLGEIDFQKETIEDIGPTAERKIEVKERELEIQNSEKNIAAAESEINKLPKPISSPSYIIIRALCLIRPSIAFESSQEKDIPLFYWSVTEGDVQLVKTVLECLRDGQKQNDDPGWDHASLQNEIDGKTAFRRACEKCNIEVVELLTGLYPFLADDASVAAMIDTAVDQDPETQERAWSVFKSIIVKRPGLANLETLQQAVKNQAKEVVVCLLKYLTTGPGGEEPDNPQKLNIKSAARIIAQCGSWDLLEALPMDSRHDSGLLHHAVEGGNIKMVKAIVENMPDQISISLMPKKPDYPINRLDKSSIEMRDLLLHAMIKSPDLGLETIRSILRAAGVEGRQWLETNGETQVDIIPANQLCLSFSTFDTREYSFTNYATQLCKAQSSAVRFERILKFASFPDLDNEDPYKREADLLQQENRIIKNFLSWLRHSRKVEEVLSLSVLDRLLCPHTDSDVSSCVQDFNIQRLDWRKLDLYLRDLNGDLRELHLYSSGNPAVLDHWEEYLPKFKKLTRLNINVVKDVLSPNRAEALVDHIQSRFNKVNEDHGNQWKSFRDGYPQDKLVVQQVDWASKSKMMIPRTSDAVGEDVVTPKLKSFIKKFVDLNRREAKLKRAKVAVIDSGVVVVDGGERSESPNTPIFSRNPCDHIMDGTSLVARENDEQAWWHATDPHGTQMANLICSINPCCELFVVKIAESSQSGVTSAKVAEAIDWAIEKEVDVISLSLVTYTDDGQTLKAAFAKAANKGIVILCSTADNGDSGKEAVSNDTDTEGDIINITACNRYGKALDQSQTGQETFLFIGEKVHVDRVSFLKSDEHITGSSAATAIAAGMASLIVACAYIPIRDGVNSVDELFRVQSTRWKKRTVQQRFKAMVNNSTGSGRPVDLEKLVDTSNTEYSIKALAEVIVYANKRKKEPR